MTKGLMDWSLHHEMVLERVCEKAKLAEEELFELKNWKVVTLAKHGGGKGHMVPPPGS